MRIRFIAAVAFALLLSLAVPAAPPEKGAMLSHDVFFTLKDKSEAARSRLVAACEKYLKGHPGEVFFAAGTLAGDLAREVNDRDFDVALHIVFRTRADHDRYQSHGRHKKFVEENQAAWARVRVFDSYVK